MTYKLVNYELAHVFAIKLLTTHAWSMGKLYRDVPPDPDIITSHPKYEEIEGNKLVVNLIRESFISCSIHRRSCRLLPRPIASWGSASRADQLPQLLFIVFGCSRTGILTWSCHMLTLDMK